MSIAAGSGTTHAQVVTARSIKALVGSLRDSELDLPFEACCCGAQVPASFAEVTADRVLVHLPGACHPSEIIREETP